MNITFLTTYISKFIYGGAIKTATELANELSSMGHSITIVTQQINNNRYVLNENIRVIEVGGPLPKNPLYWICYGRVKKLYTSALSKIHSDVIIPNTFPLNDIAASLDKKYCNKILFHCHEPYRWFHDKIFITKLDFKLKIISFVLRILFSKKDILATKKADILVSNSNFEKEKIMKTYNVEAKLCYTNPKMEYPDQIKNFNLRKHLNLNEKSKILFAIGLSSHMKGARELILIFNEIFRQMDNVYLIIGGNISKSNEKIINKQIKKLKIPHNKIIFYGFIENNNICTFYSQVDITLYPSIEEPFGLIPIESQVQKTPVISFEGGPSETIIDNKTGFVLKTGDIQGFVEKTLLLLKDDELRKKFGNDGYENVIKSFSFEKFVQDFYSILKNLYNS